MLLSFNELRAANASRVVRWHPQGINGWSLADWGIATAGELGEACNIIKKLKRDNENIVGNKEGETKEQLKINLAEELADVIIYLDLLAQAADINLAQAVRTKFNKTSEKNKFPERL